MKTNAVNLTNMTRATILILPKEGVFDPQGEAIRNALIHLGLAETLSVRVGKEIVIEFKEADQEKLKQKVEEITKNFLSNPVIEQFKIEWEKEGQ